MNKLKQNTHCKNSIISILFHLRCDSDGLCVLYVVKQASLSLRHSLRLQFHRLLLPLRVGREHVWEGGEPIRFRGFHSHFRVPRLKHVGVLGVFDRGNYGERLRKAWILALTS